MKYIVILADGMADYPVDELGGKTPMEIAKKPNMDFFAENGELLYVKTVADGMKPGSDVANLSVMGYDSARYYTGRSPLEAASIGIDLKENETTFRTNLVTLSDEENYADKTMVDYSSGEITTAEADELVKALNEHFASADMHFYTGTSYRHLLVWKDAPKEFHLTPPHDISDRKVGDYLPDNARLLSIMEESARFLKEHPVNKARIAAGKNPATSAWIWGEGTRPCLTTFKEKYGLSGSVISAVDLIKGIGFCAGMEVVKVENVTGTYTTNWKGKASAALDELKRGQDFVYIHMEAPDECGHQGDSAHKVYSIERIDEEVIGFLRRELDALGEDYAMMVLPDHPTPISLKTHVSDPVPCVIYRKGDNNQNGVTMTEENARLHGRFVEVGYKLMDEFLKK